MDLKLISLASLNCELIFSLSATLRQGRLPLSTISIETVGTDGKCWENAINCPNKRRNEIIFRERTIKSFPLNVGTGVELEVMGVKCLLCWTPFDGRFWVESIRRWNIVLKSISEMFDKRSTAKGLRNEMFENIKLQSQWGTRAKGRESIIIIARGGRIDQETRKSQHRFQYRVRNMQFGFGRRKGMFHAWSLSFGSA